MANYAVVDKDFLDDGLSQIATAIKEKTGNTENIVFPEGFKESINSIENGGSDGFWDEEFATSLIKRTIATIKFPSEIEVIGGYAFYNCTKLDFSFLPDTITQINNGAFGNCTALSSLKYIPKKVKVIGSSAFHRCLKLTSITFEGTPNSIDNTAFNNCTNLLTINVPWAEGQVAGAPWGATNATINYNYTGE